jgi:hypothetical protein
MKLRRTKKELLAIDGLISLSRRQESESDWIEKYLVCKRSGLNNVSPEILVWLERQYYFYKRRVLIPERRIMLNSIGNWGRFFREKGPIKIIRYFLFSSNAIQTQ